MSKPTEHKTAQARILAYAQEVGWTFVSREEAEERRAGFPTRRVESEDAGWKTRAPLSLFFDDLLDAKVREFNPRCTEAEGRSAEGNGLFSRGFASVIISEIR